MSHDRPTYSLQDTHPSDPFGDHSQQPGYHPAAYPEQQHTDPFASTTSLPRADFGVRDEYHEDEDLEEKIPLAQAGHGAYPPK
jgi:hypothetical protein